MKKKNGFNLKGFQLVQNFYQENNLKNNISLNFCLKEVYSVLFFKFSEISLLQNCKKNLCPRMVEKFKTKKDKTKE